MTCLVRNALSFCVAGDMISSDGEMYCWGLIHNERELQHHELRNILFTIHARLEYLAVVL
jgi:hypothetical protein